MHTHCTLLYVMLCVSFFSSNLLGHLHGVWKICQILFQLVEGSPEDTSVILHLIWIYTRHGSSHPRPIKQKRVIFFHMELSETCIK